MKVAVNNTKKDDRVVELWNRLEKKWQPIDPKPKKKLKNDSSFFYQSSLQR